MAWMGHQRTEAARGVVSRVTSAVCHGLLCYVYIYIRGLAGVDLIENSECRDICGAFSCR